MKTSEVVAQLNEVLGPGWNVSAHRHVDLSYCVAERNGVVFNVTLEAPNDKLVFVAELVEPELDEQITASAYSMRIALQQLTLFLFMYVRKRDIKMGKADKALKVMNYLI